MKSIYLDNCCFNRPYDDQSQLKIKLETIAKLSIQEMIKDGKYSLCWSYILDFENENNPFIERKVEIEKWKSLANEDISGNDNIIKRMNKLVSNGLKPLDSLHISCAIEMKCDYFLTVDKNILNKGKSISDILIINPVDFIFLEEEK